MRLLPGSEAATPLLLLQKPLTSLGWHGGDGEAGGMHVKIKSPKELWEKQKQTKKNKRRPKHTEHKGTTEMSNHEGK